jgi:release factor glutamine methyltransferase
MRVGTDRLRRVVKENPQLAVEYLLRAILKLDRVDLYLEPHRQVSASAEARFWTLVNRKLSREPLQYIIGETEWYGLTLKCDRRAMVPRPETEILTERAIALLETVDSPGIVDIGTGTGCIAVALAINLPGAVVVATDVSEAALSLAQENVETYGLYDRIHLHKASLFESLTDSRPFDLIISNPPYIRVGEYSSLMPEVRDFEPAQALLAGDDGLGVIKALIEEAPAYLKKGGWLICEFGIDHAEPVSQIANATNTYEPAEIVTDYNGQQRGVILRHL